MADAPKLRPQTVTEILDSSFRLYRENFVTFLGILAVVYVPVALILMVVTGLLTKDLYTAIQVAQAAGESPDLDVLRQIGTNALLIGGLTLLLSLVAFPMATGALTRAVGSRYLNEPATIGACYGAILKVFLKYLWTNILMGLVIALGLLLLVIPGVFFAIWFAFSSSVVILEGLGGTAAMGRSRQLSRGSAGRIIGLWLLTIILSLVLNFGIGAVCGFALPRISGDLATQTLMRQGVEQVFSMLLTPFFSVAWILLYYDIRIRTEGFDLEVLARSMASPKGFFQPPSAPREPG